MRDSLIVEVSKRLRAYNEGWSRGIEARSRMSAGWLEAETVRARAVWNATDDEIERRRAFGYLEGLQGYEGAD